MKHLGYPIAIAAMLGAGLVDCSAGEAPGRSDPVLVAQLNSPGDGLDAEAASEGNGRTRSYGGATAGRPAGAGAIVPGKGRKANMSGRRGSRCSG